MTFPQPTYKAKINLLTAASLRLIQIWLAYYPAPQLIEDLTRQCTQVGCKVKFCEDIKCIEIEARFHSPEDMKVLAIAISNHLSIQYGMNCKFDENFKEVKESNGSLS